MSSLCIISHTEHYKLADGSIVGLGSTVTEINQLHAIFDSIIHVAMLHDTKAPPSALPYEHDKIHFVALPAVGGTSLSAKMSVAFQAPKIIRIIRKALKRSDYFQFRAPTGIGVYVIPYLVWFSSKKGWFKYAGNWKQAYAPLAYRFQKWLLEHQSRPVTINGFWEDQPPQCLSFENPCLTAAEIKAGQLFTASKTFQFPVELCFVGRMEAAKGVDLIIESITNLPEQERRKITRVHLVGKGALLENYKRIAKGVDVDFVFHDLLSREHVQNIYKRCHAILLPSQSEGFPKVIAEAINYGCVPIVSNVSSIGHYINAENGFLMNTISVADVSKQLLAFLAMDDAGYQYLLAKRLEFVEKFTYTYYNSHLKSTVLHKD